MFRWEDVWHCLPDLCPTLTTKAASHFESDEKAMACKRYHIGKGDELMYSYKYTMKYTLCIANLEACTKPKVWKTICVFGVTFWPLFLLGFPPKLDSLF